MQDWKVWEGGQIVCLGLWAVLGGWLMSAELSAWAVPVSSFVQIVCNWAGLAYPNRGYCTYQVSTFLDETYLKSSLDFLVTWDIVLLNEEKLSLLVFFPSILTPSSPFLYKRTCTQIRILALSLV